MHVCGRMRSREKRAASYEDTLFPFTINTRASNIVKLRTAVVSRNDHHPGLLHTLELPHDVCVTF